jgi:hypothetical protein
VLKLRYNENVFFYNSTLKQILTLLKRTVHAIKSYLMNSSDFLLYNGNVFCYNCTLKHILILFKLTVDAIK